MFIIFYSGKLDNFIINANNSRTTSGVCIVSEIVNKHTCVHQQLMSS